MNDKRAELLKIADGRLHPSITNPAYLVLRRRRLILNDWLNSIAGEHLMVLDVGGRYQPYRPLIEDRVGRYVAFDVLSSPLVDVVGNGQQLPFKSETFDLIIATGVFEYFAEPRVAAVEMHRVLKPGGHLMLSVGGFNPRFVDTERWRFMPAGLEFTLSAFSKVTIVPEVSSVGGWLRLNATAVSNFATYEFFRQILQHTVVPIINVAGLMLEAAGASKSDQMSSNFAALAKK